MKTCKSERQNVNNVSKIAILNAFYPGAKFRTIWKDTSEDKLDYPDVSKCCVKGLTP